MVEVARSREHQGTIIEICSFGAIFCMVVAVLGIKFKWFKRRLNLQQQTPDNKYRGQSNDDFLPQGVFRKRIEEEILTENEKSKSLPPIRIRNCVKGFNIPLSREASSSNRQPVSQPSRPAVPPPNNFGIPPSEPLRTMCISKTIDLKNAQKNGVQIEEGSHKVRCFQKNEVSTGKVLPKRESRNDSIEDNDQNAHRRPTGIFPLHRTDLEDTHCKNYSQGLKLSQRNSTKQTPDLLTSIRETTSDNAEITAKEKMFLKLHESSDSENEVEDLLQKIRIPKPKPRTTVPEIQSRKNLGITGNSKEVTEA